jgi:hypothetical protein
MAHAFRPRRHAGVACKLEPEEKAIIAQVAQEVSDLVRQEMRVGDSPTAVQDAARSEDPLERLEAEFATDEAREPQDTGLQRLFPAASEDPAVAQEMRRLGQHDLAEQKLEDLGLVIRTLDASGPGKSEVLVPHDETGPWLRALNDVRLVLADRLHITSDGDFETLRMLEEIGDQMEDVPPLEQDEDVAGADVVAAVYELLTWLQDSLVRVLERS